MNKWTVAVMMAIVNIRKNMPWLNKYPLIIKGVMPTFVGLPKTINEPNNDNSLRS